MWQAQLPNRLDPKRLPLRGIHLPSSSPQPRQCRLWNPERNVRAVRVDTGRQVVVQSTGSEVAQGAESLWTRHMGFDSDRHLVPDVRDRHTDAIRCYSVRAGLAERPWSTL
jgi:hypothetical protein